METELTKKMKRGVVFFKPAMSSKMRTIRWANEVWTPSGIVDAIRFEDYVVTDKSVCALIDYQRYDKSFQDRLKAMTNGRVGGCKIQGKNFPNEHCKGCVFKRTHHELGMQITCYECKISVSDFKSPNGHNFHGNKNYYVVPQDIYATIKQMVPANIGIIIYYPKTNTFRIGKECTLANISESLKCQLLYNALKKWCDGKQI